jgi:hypothetical protein
MSLLKLEDVNENVVIVRGLKYIFPLAKSLLISSEFSRTQTHLTNLTSYAHFLTDYFKCFLNIL